TSMFINNSVPFLLTISIYVVSVAIIFTSLLLLVKKWSGRSVQD
ncbi:BsaG protein, partial [Staphylococcus epidermidis]